MIYEDAEEDWDFGKKEAVDFHSEIREEVKKCPWNSLKMEEFIKKHTLIDSDISLLFSQILYVPMLESPFDIPGIQHKQSDAQS